MAVLEKRVVAPGSGLETWRKCAALSLGTILIGLFCLMVYAIKVI